MSPDPHPPLGIDTSKPSPARAYDYLLGGHNNYEADRQAAEGVIAIWPGMREMGRGARGWAIRAVTYLAGQGVDQFLDVGSGLPTAENVHQVAQCINPESRIMYVDVDPIVHAHGRALLAANPLTRYLEADVRDPQVILPAAAAELLDFGRPIALLMSAVLHFMEDDLAELVGRYRAALAPGSYVAASLQTIVGAEPELVAAVRRVWGGHWYPRQPDEIAAIFDGLELVEPGLVRIEQWRPDGPVTPLEMPLLGAVGRIP